MKVAIASSDGVSISQHFGRSAAWLVFDIENGEVKGKEIRTNNHNYHAASGGEEHAHGHSPHAQGHTLFISALHDCQAIGCGGMGKRAADDFRRQGIEPFVVDPRMSPEEAVRAYLAGDETKLKQSFCCGRHSH